MAVSAQVQGVRLLIVNEGSELLEIWSNTDSPVALTARLGGRAGRDVSLTPAMRSAYDVLAPTIAPGATGLVYARSSSG